MSSETTFPIGWPSPNGSSQTCPHGQEWYMTCVPCGRMLPGANGPVWYYPLPDPALIARLDRIIELLERADPHRATKEPSRG
jgi:hypothetical protein